MKPLSDILKECERLAFDLNFVRAKNWKEEKLSKVVLSSFISDILFHIIVVSIEYEHRKEYLMWFPVSFFFILFVGIVSIIVFKILFLFF